MISCFTQTGNIQFFVSQNDIEWVKKYKWYNHSGGYIKRKEGKKNYYLHREIFLRQGLEIDGKEIDHINLCKKDNTRENLRIASRSQNMANTRKSNNRSSKYKGVYLSSSNKWISGIKHNNIYFFRLSVDSELLAAQIYDFWARRLFGEFASCNFEYISPEEEEKIKNLVFASSGNSRSGFKGIKICNNKYFVIVSGISIFSTSDLKKAIAARHIHMGSITPVIAEYLSVNIGEVKKLMLEYQESKTKKTSSYKGVSFKSANKKWVAQLTLNRRKMYIGLYDTEEQAFLAYSKKVDELNLNSN